MPKRWASIVFSSARSLAWRKRDALWARASKRFSECATVSVGWCVAGKEGESLPLLRNLSAAETIVDEGGVFSLAIVFIVSAVLGLVGERGVEFSQRGGKSGVALSRAEFNFSKPPRVSTIVARVLLFVE